MRSIRRLALMALAALWSLSALAADPIYKLVRVVSATEIKYRIGTYQDTWHLANAAVPAKGPVAVAAKAFTEQWFKGGGMLGAGSGSGGDDVRAKMPDGSRRDLGEDLIAAGLAVAATGGQATDARAFAKLEAMTAAPSPRAK